MNGNNQVKRARMKAYYALRDVCGFLDNEQEAGAARAAFGTNTTSAKAAHTVCRLYNYIDARRACAIHT